jgi:hypothetical protein
MPGTERVIAFSQLAVKGLNPALKLAYFSVYIFYIILIVLHGSTVAAL